MALPRSLDWIADSLGWDATNRILLKFSGRRIYIPSAKNLTPDHELVEALGWETAYNLCKLVQVSEDCGDRIELAYRYTPDLRAERAAVIKKMKDFDFTNQEISLVSNLCQRAIRKISNSKFPLSVKAKRVHYEGQLKLL